MVHELIRRILAISALHPNSGVGYTINKYGNYETLLLWHRGSQHLAEGLMPVTTAQAFHIVPFPDGVNNEQIFREQVKLSWYNGYLLGYPTQFIDTYCRDLQKSLDPYVVDMEMRSGYSAVLGYLRSLGKPDHVSIGEKSLELVDANFFKFAKEVLNEHHVFFRHENKEYL